MKHYKKYYIIPATPEEVYRALTTETTIQLWTGDVARIDPTVGGEFSMWDDAITGQYMALEPFHKIVQEWYFGDQQQRSIVTIKLHEHKRGTSFELHHEHIPETDYADIVAGWNEVYLQSLIDFYAVEN